MKVFKIADIINNEVLYCAVGGWKKGDVAAMLTNLEAVDEPREGVNWKLDMVLGKGASTQTFKLDLRPQISVHDSLDAPLFLAEERLVFFQDRLFLPERAPRTIAEREEVILRTKKIVYEEQAEIASLKASVANLEAAITYTESGPRRDPIPDDVKLVVWARDGGACVRCGSKAGLHFDHIIPVAKGGGNIEANIQILCAPCNLRKSDKIAST